MKRNTFLLNGLRCMLAFAATILMQPLFARQPATSQPNAPALTHVKQMPTYLDGGIERFAGWMYKEMQYPQAAIEEGIGGSVDLRFVVETDGSIDNLELRESDHPDFTQEILRVVRSAPNWTPGMQNGKFVRVKYTLPIVFNLPYR